MAKDDFREHNALPQMVAGTTGQPVIGGEILVSALDNKQVFPAVAYNPRHREYLVVWQNTWGGNSDIYAQRITEEGLLKSWFAVTAGPNDRAEPAVAYDRVNDRYLVTWAHDVSGNGANWDIWGRIIPWNGSNPALAEFVICNWPTAQLSPKVAYGRARRNLWSSG